MAKKTYEANWADKSITVHSIKVLQDLDSPGLKSIKVNVESLQSQAKQFDLEQANYWSDLASDGIITPYEKKILLKQYEEIKQSYVALLNQATSQSLQGTTYFLDYQTVYNELRTYLYTTLALFDDMEINTIISDREAFNSYFSAYYYDEKFVTIALTTGIMGNLGFRVLSSLSESGTEGEIGLYHGVIYQYTNGTWVAVGLEGYVGTRNSLPTATLNQYFLASEDFTSDEPLYVNDEPLYVNNEALYVTCFFEEGYIYVCDEDGAWQKITDTGDYRYVVAMVDLISITGQLPGAFQEAIDAGDAAVTASLTASFTASLEEEIAARQGQYTVINNQLVLITEDLASQLARIEQLSSDLNGKISHLPVYLGPATTAPSGAQEGDYFVYTGTESGSWHNSGVYIYQSGSWNYLDPSSANNYYMYCLDDILACNNTTSGYFAYIFATAFWAHSITTEKLSTRVLYLQSGGYIRSANTGYVAGTSGLQIDYDGNIDANGNTHIGGTCTIDGNTTIGGTLDVSGTATFAGTTTIGGNAFFSGRLDCEVFKIDTATEDIVVKSYPMSESSSVSSVFSEIRTIANTYGTNNVYRGYVSTVYGDYTYLVINGVYYPKMQAQYTYASSYTTVNLYAINESETEEILIYKYWSSDIDEGSEFNYDFLVKFYRENVAYVEFIDLPTSDPAIEGRAWIDNGTLKVSLG